MKNYRIFLQTASSAANSFSFLYGAANLFGITGGLVSSGRQSREIRELNNHLKRDIGILD